jgi:cytochrome o ubiquinol oxidase operon protein cyoD
MSEHHSNEHAAAHHDEEGADHGSLRSYMTGFALSAVLTAVPFALIMSSARINDAILIFVLAAFAMIQIVVHMIYFLHMNPRSEGGWNLLALIFTIVLVVITLSGSLWIMYHLNTNMMPVHDMSQMP